MVGAPSTVSCERAKLEPWQAPGACRRAISARSSARRALSTPAASPEASAIFSAISPAARRLMPARHKSSWSQAFGGRSRTCAPAEAPSAALGQVEQAASDGRRASAATASPGAVPMQTSAATPPWWQAAPAEAAPATPGGRHPSFQAPSMRHRSNAFMGGVCSPWSAQSRASLSRRPTSCWARSVSSSSSSSKSASSRVGKAPESQADEASAVCDASVARSCGDCAVPASKRPRPEGVALVSWCAACSVGRWRLSLAA
eukprot:scaffold3819_cov107-Isochrysis_galbana.AAC.7